MGNTLILIFVAIAILTVLCVYYLSVAGQSHETRKRSWWIPFAMWRDEFKMDVGEKQEGDYNNDEYNELHRKK